MLRTSFRCFAFAMIAALNVPADPVAAQDAEQARKVERERRLAIMSKLIGEIRMFENIDGEEVELRRGEKPVTHFDDNVRQHVDGTLWAFTRNDRPVALITCTARNPLTRRWSHAVASLSLNRLRGEQTGRTVWTPESPGIEYRPLPNPVPPASTSTQRRLQLRQIARRFDAHEFWNPDNQRFTLRLSPRPVLVHSAESAGVLDGSVFLFNHGVNPELALMIEAVRDQDTVSWRYAIAKLGSAEFHASLDGKEIYQSPRAPNIVGRSVDPYFLFSSTERD